MFTKKYFNLSVLVVTVFLLLLGYATLREGLRNTKRSERLVTISSPDGLLLARYQAEVADTWVKRARGLSGRTTLPADTGLLFLFDRADRYPFWMKEMNFPIDIVWFNQDKVIIDITSNLATSTYPNTVRPRQPAHYVLEIPAGEATEAGIEVGDRGEF